MARYLIVSTDPGDLVAKGGPIEWDGATRYAPPDGTRLIPETAALAAGYTPPARPGQGRVDAGARELLTGGLAANAGYLSAGTHTAAQNAAQIRALTQQIDTLTRLVLGLPADEGA